MADIFRSKYRKLTPEEQTALTAIKEQAQVLYDEIESAAGDPRCTALAKTKLEEAVMFAVKAVTG